MAENISLVTFCEDRGMTISLHQAVRIKDLPTMKKFNVGSEELNECDSYGYTPLHYAAKYGYYDILQKLLEKQPKLDVESREENYTVLHFLALQKTAGEDKELLFLLEDVLSHLELEKMNDKHNPVLHLACRSGNLTMVKILLNKNFYLEQLRFSHPSSQNTPLHEATLSRNASIVSELIQKLTKVKLYENLTEKEYHNSEELSPLHIACRDGLFEIVEMFFDGIEQRKNKVKGLANSRAVKGKTPLHFACQCGDERIVSLLMQRGGEILRNENGSLPIHIAAQYGHVGVVDRILDGSSIDEVDNYQNTPLKIATRYGRVEMIEKLLNEKGADPSIRNNELLTPLLSVAINGNYRAYKALVAGGASLDDRDTCGRSVIHIAAYKDNPDFLRNVFEDRSMKEKYNDIVNSTDKYLCTPLHLAAEKGSTDCVRELIKWENINLEAKNNKLQTPLHCAAGNGNYIIMKLLLKQSCRFLVSDKDGNTPLHIVCQHGHFEGTELLLLNQVGFDKRNKQKHTPLDVAAMQGQDRLVRLLIRTISDSNPKDTIEALINPTKEFDSPLHLAVVEGHQAVVEALIEEHANVTLENYLTKKTPLQVAIEVENEGVAKVILGSSMQNLKDALECRWVTDHGSPPTTFFKQLVKKMPALAKLALDTSSAIQEIPGGLTSTFRFYFTKERCEEKSSEDFFRDKELKMSNYWSYNPDKWWKVLIPWSFSGIQQAHPLLLMINFNRKELLQHPLIMKMRQQKWIVQGLPFYIAGLAFYSLFAILLTLYALYSPNPQLPTCLAVNNGIFGETGNASQFYFISNSQCSSLNSSNDTIMGDVLSFSDTCSREEARSICDLNKAQCGICPESEERKGLLVFCASLIAGMVGILVALEILQVYTLGLTYLRDWTNYLEVILYITSILFISSAVHRCMCAAYWQWQVGVVAVFLAWIEFLIFIRILPGGIHILMFEKIFKSFMKSIFLTAVLIQAFAIVFYMLFYIPTQEFTRSPFNAEGRAFIKVMSMTIGEIDFNSVFRLFPGGISPEKNVEEIPFFSVSVLIWIIFIIMMPILYSNLLTGLAIDDVQRIRERAAMKSLKLKLQFALDMEELLLKVKPFRRRFGYKLTSPDDSISWWQKFISQIIPDELGKDNTHEGPPQKETESEKKTKRNMEDLMQKMTLIETSIKCLEQRF